jgi:hypothetical protein
MTLKEWWCEVADVEWTENRLLSRKWLLVVGVILWALVVDVAGRPLSDTTANIIEWTVPPWVAIQGFVDMYRYRAGAQKVKRHRKKKEEGNHE